MPPAGDCLAFAGALVRRIARAGAWAKMRGVCAAKERDAECFGWSGTPPDVFFGGRALFRHPFISFCGMPGLAWMDLPAISRDPETQAGLSQCPELGTAFFILNPSAAPPPEFLESWLWLCLFSLFSFVSLLKCFCIEQEAIRRTHWLFCSPFEAWGFFCLVDGVNSGVCRALIFLF